MTPAIVQALEKSSYGRSLSIQDEGEMAVGNALEPCLLPPQLGNPISHFQVLELSRSLKSAGDGPYHLDILLKGSRVYLSPPPPKAEPSSEYKALMARLRAEEESRAYERMLNPTPATETSSYRFPSDPTNSAAFAFSSTAAYMPAATSPEDDELSFANVNSQVALIANVLISVLCCAAAIWMVARWWSTPARLALSMSGSLLVGVAEVAVYMGYVRRVEEAKTKEGKKREIKEVVKTWVVGGGLGADDDMDEKESVKLINVENDVPEGVRKRRK